MAEDAEDIVFCAKTGHRIVGDNVIPFPCPGAKPVPVEASPAPENDDI